jgi:hypothetical protein
MAEETPISEEVLRQALADIELLTGMYRTSLIQNSALILDQIDNAINRTSGNLRQNLVDIRLAARSIFDLVRGSYTSTGTRLQTAVSAAQDEIQALNQSWLDQILAGINDVVSGVTGAAENTIESLAVAIDDASDFAAAIVSDSQSAIESTVGAAVESLSNFLSDVRSIIDSDFEQSFFRLETIERDLRDKINDTIETVTREVSFQATQTTNTVLQAVQDSGAAITEFVAPIVPTLEAAGAMIDTGVSRLADIWQTIIGPAINSLPEEIFAVARERAEGQINEMSPLLDQLQRAIAVASGLDEKALADAGITDIFGIAGRSFLAALMGLVSVPLILQSMMQTVLAPAHNNLLHNISREVPFSLLTPNEAAAAKRRGLMTQEEYSNDVKGAGFDDSRAAVLQLLDTVELPPGDALSIWLRGEKDEDWLNEILGRIGYLPEAQDVIKKLAFFIPPVQDLITMAVREAFTPNIISQYGLEEDFPPEFAREAAKQGVSEDWAKKYWASHWRLPSLTDAFEMFHRRVITRDDLITLMRTQDIMPFWRDKLIDIAFNPLTRVDVRRMHKLGVLDDQQTFNAYLDIGYNEENAQNLLRFTILANEGEDALLPGESLDIVRPQVERALASGAVSHSDAVDILRATGLSNDSAELVADSIELKAILDARDAEKDAIIAQASNGIIAFDVAYDKLSALNLSAQELQKSVADIERLRTGNSKSPTRAELQTMLSKGIITAPQWYNAMLLQGYGDFWTRKFYRLITGAEIDGAITAGNTGTAVPRGGQESEN